MSGGHDPLRSYLRVFVALIALTAVTAGVAYVDLGPWNTVIALCIAAAKGLLVALFFMHLSDAPLLQRMVALGAVFWLLVLLLLILVDFRTRAAVPGW